MLPLVQMVTLYSRAVIPCWPIPYVRARPYHLGRWQLWDDTYIYIHIVILHWYQLVITYRVGYHVRFCDISAQQRGRKYYVFPTWYKNKEVITAFCPKPSTANFMQRNLLLFSRHLPFLLLCAITCHLDLRQPRGHFLLDLPLLGLTCISGP